MSEPRTSRESDEADRKVSKRLELSTSISTVFQVITTFSVVGSFLCMLWLKANFVTQEQNKNNTDRLDKDERIMDTLVNVTNNHNTVLVEQGAVIVSQQQKQQNIEIELARLEATEEAVKKSSALNTAPIPLSSHTTIAQVDQNK